MSRVIDGGNVAAYYTVFAAVLVDFFDSLLKGERHEIPPGYAGHWKGALFDPVEDWFYFNSRSDKRLKPVGREPLQRNLIEGCVATQLILDCYEGCGAPLGIVPSDIGGFRETVLEIRDLTSMLVQNRRLPSSMRKQAEFLRDFYRNLLDKGNEDKETELFAGMPGRYGFGTRDFEDD